jgi:hypothetical protein
MFLQNPPTEFQLIEHRFLRFLERQFFSAWWVIAVFLCCAVVYERSVYQTELEFQKLELYAKEIEDLKLQAALLHQDLQLQLNSQSDPEWIAITLMKGLGLVPEGYKKYYFPDVP